MVAPSGEKATERTQSLCALCFSALSSREAVASMAVLSFGLGEEYGGLGVPASQTLIVISFEPDTMVAPSGEKATERT